jgi:hypothetical protein
MWQRVSRYDTAFGASATASYVDDLNRRADPEVNIEPADGGDVPQAAMTPFIRPPALTSALPRTTSEREEPNAELSSPPTCSTTQAPASRPSGRDAVGSVRALTPTPMLICVPPSKAVQTYGH